MLPEHPVILRQEYAVKSQGSQPIAGHIVQNGRMIADPPVADDIAVPRPDPQRMGGEGAQGIQIALQPDLQVAPDAALPEEQGQLREASAEITIVDGARQGGKQLIRRKGP